LDERFMSALCAPLPSDEIPFEHRIFRPLIGSWDLLVEWFDEDGNVVRSSNGEWHFSWVLEGRGVQDVWIVPPRGRRGSKEPYEYGTSIRFYDHELGAWRSTWIGPMRSWIMRFIARKAGDEIVMESQEKAEPYRWAFSNITENSFNWRNELEVSPGKWRLEQRFAARRMG
jgi:hypothetical protein